MRQSHPPINNSHEPHSIWLSLIALLLLLLVVIAYLADSDARRHHTAHPEGNPSLVISTEGEMTVTKR